MSLIETIQQLNTVPRAQEEEYEYTSDFLEWFYYNLYREQGFTIYPVLHDISKEAEYECMRELCKILINFNKAKTYNNEALIAKYENMKQWTLDNIKKYQNE